MLSGSASALGVELSPPILWGQFQGTAAHVGVAQAGPEPPYKVAWRFEIPPVNGEGLSVPVIGNGLAITVGPKAVYGVDTATGRQRWSVPRDAKPTPPALAQVGHVTAVLYADGTDTKTAQLKAIDVATQQPVWAPVTLKAPASSGVSIDEGTAYVGDEQGDVYAVDANTGQIRWTKTVPGEARGPITVAQGLVFVVALPQTAQQQTLASVVALDASTGEQVWTFAPRAGTVFASLGSVSNGTLLVSFREGASSGVVYGLGASDGSTKWSTRVAYFTSPLTSPAVKDGHVFVGSFTGGIERLEAGSGTRDWLFQYNQQVFRSSPVVVGGVVLLGLNDGSLGAVDISTGHLIWQSAATPGLVGSMAVAGDLVIAVKGGNRGGLVAFERDPNGRLIDVQSPTIPRYGSILVNFAAAFVVAGVAILVPLTIASRRFGSADFSGAEDGDEDDEDDEDDGADG